MLWLTSSVEAHRTVHLIYFKPQMQPVCMVTRVGVTLASPLPLQLLLTVLMKWHRWYDMLCMTSFHYPSAVGDNGR